MQKIFHKAVNAASDSKDGGFYEYYRSRPGQHIPLHKISYAMSFRPYNWIIYTDASPPDIEQDIQQEVLEHLGHVTFGCEGHIQAFNQVLDLSKIEAGRITLDETDFDLRELLCELEEMFRIQADQKMLSLTFKCSETVPRYADAGITFSAVGRYACQVPTDRAGRRFRSSSTSH